MIFIIINIIIFLSIFLFIQINNKNNRFRICYAIKYIFKRDMKFVRFFCCFINKYNLIFKNGRGNF